MDGDVDAAVAEAFEDGWNQGFTAAGGGCSCPHRDGCPAGGQDEAPSWWRRWLDAVTS
ncbi:hypothetical protein [Actinomycetospora termitidis]|uniref:Uncharacterized protein n=1 Tax=Actinomycetospora termitidis TaxID=3053470 RepID=A0ABT7MFK6_9PSEU|nr:hypothetical protein [Actinomycetospora sp. Odt1-22]MDL5159451.1 hypothetical protein [Actinomycetospora sp. Odt1-22]